ncbi:hypothetical protein F2Q70_00025335 [Brassica cretica]|uniref:Uncharacterized protein n=1 Tax=Brassica cretica TaxID=69181 RepID=A0A8S9LDP1_BRACR|nr:hypothetical protein F2Q70_00025335 [Brassica cretica]
MLFSCTPPSTLSDSVDLPRPLVVVASIFGLEKTKKQGEFMGITLLLLYEKITEHPFVIRFIPQTTIDEVIENALIINLEKFMLRKFDPFQALANTNLELHVVVGQFQSVQSLDLKDATVTSQVVVRFLIEPVVVYLSLWDDAGAVFRGLFNSGERGRVCHGGHYCESQNIWSGTAAQIFNTNEAPFVQEEGGEPSASVTYKVGGKANEPYLSGVEGKEGVRKRPRN